MIGHSDEVMIIASRRESADAITWLSGCIASAICLSPHLSMQDLTSQQAARCTWDMH